MAELGRFKKYCTRSSASLPQKNDARSQENSGVMGTDALPRVRFRLAVFSEFRLIACVSSPDSHRPQRRTPSRGVHLIPGKSNWVLLAVCTDRRERWLAADPDIVAASQWSLGG